jgi:hypothetical protein
MNVWEEMSGATGMQQWHKGPKPKRVAMCRKQEVIQQGSQADFQTRGCEASSWDFHQVTESVWLDIVEGSVPSKMTEEMSKAQPSEKNKDDGGAPGLAHTLSSNHLGRSVLRREQQEQLESDHRENQATEGR